VSEGFVRLPSDQCQRLTAKGVYMTSEEVRQHPAPKSLVRISAGRERVGDGPLYLRNRFGRQPRKCSFVKKFSQCIKNHWGSGISAIVKIRQAS
jgi:hypothetical protein